MRIINNVGHIDVAKQIRFSKNACKAGLQAIGKNKKILCDVENVRHGIHTNLIEREPLCFINAPGVPAMAKSRNEPVCMTALTYWLTHLSGSIVMIRDSPSVLFRLLEMFKIGAPKPALIISMPVGFTMAPLAKKTLWDAHESMGIECITMLGTQGSSLVTASALNALSHCHHGEFY